MSDMELTSDPSPATIEINVRELEVGVQGDVRQFMLYDRDWLEFASNGEIIVRMKAVDGTTILEETVLRTQHIQWFTVRYRTVRQLVDETVTESKG